MPNRAIAVAALTAVAALSWLLLWESAALMNEMRGQGLLFDLMMAMMHPQATALYLLAASLMWAVMMLAMMTPAVLPLVTTFWNIKRAGTPRKTSHGVAFAASYLLIWCAFGVVLSLVQWLLHRGAVLSTHLLEASPALSASFLISAGLYQLTPIKAACLRHCQNPMSFLLTHWRDGWRGALRMGFVHGFYCLGCCWALMLLMFVGGVMSVGFMALICVFILAERLLPPSRWTTALPGVILVAWGAWQLALAIKST